MFTNILFLTNTQIIQLKLLADESSLVLLKNCQPK